MRFKILAYFALAGLAIIGGCSSNGDHLSGKQEADVKSDFDTEILAALYGDGGDTSQRDIRELQARREATRDGKFDSELYERLLKEKKAVIPNILVVYTLVNTGYYESGGLWYALITADKKIIVEGEDLTDESWQQIRNAYGNSAAEILPAIDDDARRIIISQLENHTAVRRDGRWRIDAPREVQ